VEGVPLVTDDAKNSTKMEVSTNAINNVEIFRQLLNQETLIRMTLVKNVHALMKDMVTLKQSLLIAENGLSDLKQTNEQEIKTLKDEIKQLLQENQKLKDKTNEISNQSSSIIKDVEGIRNDGKQFQSRFSEGRERFEKNMSKILTDTKTEVRYLSITLFDLDERARKMQNEIPGRVEEVYNNISKSLNKSLIQVEDNLVASNKNQEHLKNTIATMKKGQSLMSSGVEGRTTV
jgi:predicted  nucleic acid-binding Zn-ribbon protein